MTSSLDDDWHRRKQRVELPKKQPMAFIDSGGSEPVLLLLHGFSDTSRSFSVLEPFLAGYRLIIPDLPGHGASARGDGLLVGDFAESIDHLLAVLGISRMAIIGHSMGAMTAIELAVRRKSDVSALVLLSASLRPDFGSESSLTRGIRALSDPIRPSDSFFDDWYSCGRPIDPDLLWKLRSDAAAMPANIWHGILDGFGETDLKPSASQIAAPVLCLSGSDDPLFDASHREAVMDGFASARSITLSGYGHNPHWENPQHVSELIVSFLGEEWPSNCGGRPEKNDGNDRVGS
jgi:pimeloyl-ACP methyl ester carboxylesterase